MKKLIKAYIPFLIYAIIILVFYFFQYYFFPKYCEALALLSLFLYILFLLYIYIGAFVVSYFLGKIVQKRLSNSNIGICIILAIISSLIIGGLGGIREIFWELHSGFKIDFSTFLAGLHNLGTKIYAYGTFICFFVGELDMLKKMKW